MSGFTKDEMIAFDCAAENPALLRAIAPTEVDRLPEAGGDISMIRTQLADGRRLCVVKRADLSALSTDLRWFIEKEPQS